MMTLENIKPAVNIKDEQHQQMSAAEFQKRLYGWFEEKGLLSELRAHLRKQMIEALNDTAIGRAVTNKQKQVVSPKLQAYNLLVAEFLLHHNYHYSLSVFSTEVPLISVLPEFPGLKINEPDNQPNSIKWQFSEKDMWDILDTIGIRQHSDEGRSIHTDYYKGTTKQPLLTCILKVINTIRSKSRSNSFERTVSKTKNCAATKSKLICENYEGWVKTVFEILNSNFIQSHNIKEILNVVINEVDTEKKRLENHTQEEYIKLQANISKNEEEQTRKWKIVNDSLEAEKSKIQNDIMRRKIETEQFRLKIKSHQEVLRDRYEEITRREKEISEREIRLRQKEELLKEQHQRLEAGFDSLYSERRIVSDLQKQLNIEISQKQENAKNDAVFLEQLQQECKDVQEHIINSQEVLLNASKSSNEEHMDAESNEIAKNEIMQLQLENIALKQTETEQKMLIKELSERASYLIRDLESSQAAVTILSNSHNTVASGYLGAPPLLAPPSASLQRNTTNYINGAGEDFARRAASVSSRSIRNFDGRDANRRTPPRRLTVHSSSGSEDGMPTSDILQEARERLRRLEEESEQVDRNYQQFKLKRAQEGFPLTRHFRQTPFGSAAWLSEINREFEPLKHYRDETKSSSYNKKNSRLYNGVQSDGKSSPGSSSNYSTRSKFVEYTPSNLPPFADIIKTTEKKVVKNKSKKNKIHVEPIETQKMEVDAKKEAKNEENNNIHLDNQSLASSGILEEILAAGVSISDVDTSDDKSDI